MKIAILPVGPVPADLLRKVAAGLREGGLEPELLAAVPIPPATLDDRRAQHRAEAILNFVVVQRPGDVVAITTADLFTEGLNFVFGLANAGVAGALVSIHRLAAADRERFADRVVKECLHEIGHTRGLAHGENATCVMHFSNSLEEVDAKGRAFCENCKRDLERLTASSPL